MRGLSTEEARLLSDVFRFDDGGRGPCGAHCGARPLHGTKCDIPTARRLQARGLVVLTDCGFDDSRLHCWGSTLGREALRIHDAIRAMGISI